MIFHLLSLAESLMTYEPRGSFLEKLNPITKLTILVSIVIGGIYVSGPSFPWWVSFAIFVALLGVCLASGLDLKAEMKLRGAYVAAIATIIFVANLVFSQGGTGASDTSVVTYISVGPFINITSLSLNYALNKTLLILNSVLAIIMLLKTTRLSDLTYSIQKIGVPYAVAQLISTSLRCIPMVTDGLLIVYNAQRARGMELDRGTLRERVKQWGSLLGPLMLVLLKWIDQMSIVFQSRGLDFQSRQRTRLRVVPFGVADWIVTFGTLGALGALIIAASSGALHIA